MAAEGLASIDTDAEGFDEVVVDLGEVYGDAPAGRDGGADDHGRAADALCDVTLAIEAVDYNALIEPHLAELMDAYETIMDMTLTYRQNQHALEE